MLLLAGLGQLGSLQSLAFKDCSWLGDASPNVPSWCPSLSGLTALTELVFNHCPQLNTLPDAVRFTAHSPNPFPVCVHFLRPKVLTPPCLRTFSCICLTITYTRMGVRCQVTKLPFGSRAEVTRLRYFQDAGRTLGRGTCV